MCCFSIWEIWQNLYNTGEPEWLRIVLTRLLMISWISPIWAPVLFAILIKKRHGKIGGWRRLLLVLSTIILFLLAGCLFSDMGAETLAVCLILWLVVITLLFLVWRIK